MGLLGDILLALLCGGKSGKGRTAAQDVCLTREEWYALFLSAGHKLP